MCPIQGIARSTCSAVVGQQAQAAEAVVTRREVAKLGVQAHTAASGKSGREGGVAVGRDVPVIRHGHLQTAFAVQVDGRRQPARFALVGQRKTQRGRRQYGQPKEAQHSAFGNAFIGIEVQPHFVAGQQPRRAARAVGRTAGVGCLCRHGALLAKKLQALGHTARPNTAKKISRVVKKAFKAAQLQRHLGATEGVAVAAEFHPTFCLSQVGGLVVTQAVGFDDHTGAAQHRVAFGHHIFVRPTAQLARRQNNRRGPCRLRAFNR